MQKIKILPSRPRQVGERMTGKSVKCFVCGKRVFVTKFHIETSGLETGTRYFHKGCYKPGMEDKNFVGEGPAYNDDRKIRREKEVKKIRCEFCQGEVEESTDLDETVRECPHCRAIYWLEFPDDLYLATQDAADYFKFDYNETFEKIELKIVENFDQLGEGEYKEEVCLVFARKKPEA